MIKTAHSLGERASRVVYQAAMNEMKKKYPDLYPGQIEQQDDFYDKVQELAWEFLMAFQESFVVMFLDE
jgi:hypothetical protein